MKSYSVPVECVKRGFEASFLMDMSPDYYIDKYIKGKDLPFDQDFQDVYLGLMKLGP